MNSTMTRTAGGPTAAATPGSGANHEWRPVVRKGEPTMGDQLRLAGALLAPALLLGLLFVSLVALLPLVPLIPLAIVAWRLRGRVRFAARMTRPAALPMRTRLVAARSRG